MIPLCRRKAAIDRVLRIGAEGVVVALTHRKLPFWLLPLTEGSGRSSHRRRSTRYQVVDKVAPRLPPSLPLAGFVTTRHVADDD
jgi:hypothetical protein